MGKKKQQIPQFALDENGILKKVQSLSFRNYKKSPWHTFCNKKRKQQNFANRRESYLIKMKEYRVSNKQQLSQKYAIKYPQLRQKKLQRHKQFRKQNPQLCKTRQKSQRDKHRQAICKRNCLYQAKRMKLDPRYKLGRRISGNIKCALKSVGVVKKQKTTQHLYLKCSKQAFAEYLLSLMPENSSLKDISQFGYQIDHIIPISAYLTCDFNHQFIEQNYLIRLNHFTNFRPLWWSQNISKGNSRSDELTKLSDDRYNQWRIKQNDNIDFSI